MRQSIQLKTIQTILNLSPFAFVYYQNQSGLLKIQILKV